MKWNKGLKIFGKEFVKIFITHIREGTVFTIVIVLVWMIPGRDELVTLISFWITYIILSIIYAIKETRKKSKTED